MSSRNQHVSWDTPVGHTCTDVNKLALNISDLTDHSLTCAGASKLDLRTFDKGILVLVCDLATGKLDRGDDRIQLVVSKSTMNDASVNFLNRSHLLLRFVYCKDIIANNGINVNLVYY